MYTLRFLDSISSRERKKESEEKGNQVIIRNYVEQEQSWTPGRIRDRRGGTSSTP